MGTRSTITIVLNENDKTRALRFNPDLLEFPRVFTKDEKRLFRKILPLDKVPFPEYMCPEGKTCLTTYCQFDGSPGGVGSELFTHYSEYGKALNLILAGPLESIVSSEGAGGVLPCLQQDPDTTRPGNQFTTCGSTPLGMDAAYNYLFQNGSWYVKPAGKSEKYFVEMDTIRKYQKIVDETTMLSCEWLKPFGLSCRTVIYPIWDSAVGMYESGTVFEKEILIDIDAWEIASCDATEYDKAEEVAITIYHEVGHALLEQLIDWANDLPEMATLLKGDFGKRYYDVFNDDNMSEEQLVEDFGRCFHYGRGSLLKACFEEANAILNVQ